MIDHSTIISIQALHIHAATVTNLGVPSHGSSIKDLGTEISNALFPNVPTFIGHIVATIILLTVIYRFGYIPFRQSQRNKHDYIANQIDSAIEKNSIATKTNLEAQELLEKTRNKASDVMSDAYDSIKLEQEKAVDRAKEQQQVLLRDAKGNIERQQEQFDQNAKDKISELSFLLAEKIARKKIKKDSEKEMVDDFLKDVDLDIHTHEQH